MKVIGITGGAGSGKSAVMDLIERHFSAYCILTDDVARELMKRGEKSYQLVVEYFGKEILNDEQEIDRLKLSRIVFQNPEKLEKLNSFTHPYVKKTIIKEIDKIKKENNFQFIFIEAAILIEAGFADICDEIWYIFAAEELRRRRLKESRGYSDEKIDSIVKNQLSEKKFRDICRHTIENNGNLDDVLGKIEDILVSK